MRNRTIAGLVLALALAPLAACGGSSDATKPADAATATSTSAETSVTTSTSTASSTSGTTSEPAEDEIDVRVVADSEVPDGVSKLLDQQPGIRVSSMSSTGGATMEELDPNVEAALAQHPDVLVYAGGTNNLKDGPRKLLAGVVERLKRYGEQTCVVYAVPVFRYQRGTRDEVERGQKGTRVLEQYASATGAHVASYLDVSMAMDDVGEDFFAPGGLGDLHPDPRSYPRIAASIAEQVRACA